MISNEQLFEEVSIKATFRFHDSQGRRKQETRRFWQTINPFNTNSDGSIKTRSQIISELEAERDLWLTECKETLSESI